MMDLGVEVLSNCVTLFKIFGYQYFSLKNVLVKKSSNSSRVWNAIHFCLSFLVITCIAVIYAWLVSQDSSEISLSAKNALSFVMQQLFQVGLIIIYCVSSTQSFTSSSRMIKFFKNSIEISQIFQCTFQHSLNYSGFRKKVFGLFTFSCFYIFFVNIFLYAHEDESSPVKMVFFSILMVYQLVGVIRMVFLFNLVSFHLESMRKSLDKMFASQPIDLNVFTKTLKTKNPHDLNSKVQSLRKVYNIILENCEILNLSCGVTLLTIFTMMIVVISSCCYKFFLIFMGKVPESQFWGIKC